MQAICRASQKLSTMVARDQRLVISSVRQIHRTAPVATEAMPLPTKEKIYPEKIVTIVDQISVLNLLEVADLNELLKARLNISDAPVMMAAGPGVAAPAKVEEEEEEAAAPAAVQTSFTVKLTKFDAAKKVAIIKGIKGIVEGMNLVQAKKFVESAPAVVKADVSKEEADKIKEELTALGGECTIE